MKIRTEAKRLQIIQVAAELFTECGYERASMNELAKRLGGSKATLYGYFSSKDQIFVAVVRAFATRHLVEATAELKKGFKDEETFKNTLHRFAERMLQVTTNDTQAIAVYRMVLAETGRSEVGQLFHEAGPSECVAALTSLMTEAINHGLLCNADPSVLAKQFLALATAEVEARVFLKNPAPLSLTIIQQIASRAVNMFFVGAALR